MIHDISYLITSPYHNHYSRTIMYYKTDNKVIIIQMNAITTNKTNTKWKNVVVSTLKHKIKRNFNGVVYAKQYQTHIT